MATIEDDVAAVVAMWDEGMLGRLEVTGKLMDLLTPTNIADVVAATPEPWRTELVDRLRDIGESEGPLLRIEAVLYSYEFEPDPARRAAMKADVDRARAAEQAHFENAVRPAIRAWLRGLRPT
ncbi:MAG TPA: hypothetical protein VIQ54_30515 [Polyangia bacterium]